MIVGVKEGLSAQALRQTAVTLGGRVRKEIPGTAFLMDFPSEAAAVTAVGSLSRHSAVLFLERNGFLHIPPLSTRRNRKGS